MLVAPGKLVYPVLVPHEMQVDPSVVEIAVLIINFPAAQSWQITSPLADLNFPARHDRHDKELLERPYPIAQIQTPWAPLRIEESPVVGPDETYPVVAVQSIQTSDICVFVVESMYLPAMQSVQIASAGVLFHLPETQATHGAALNARPYPASQIQECCISISVAPAILVYPIPQFKHMELSVWADKVLIIYVRAAQSVQTASPVVVLYLPAGHATHDVDLSTRPYPAAQMHTPWAPFMLTTESIN